jgi:CBS domain-containing protein
VVFWRGALLPPDATMQQAIQNLNDSTLKICLVVDRDQKLWGTVSDGDIRRGLLRGLGLSKCVVDVMLRDPLVVPPNVTRGQIQRLMEFHRIQQIPEVDDTKKLSGCISGKSSPATRDAAIAWSSWREVWVCGCAPTQSRAPSRCFP